MDREIQTVLEKNEKVEWTGKQDIVSSMILGVAGVFALLLFGLFFYYGFSNGVGECTINGQIRPPEDCAGMGKYVSYGIFALAFLSLIFIYLRYLVTRYVITNKRILLKSGLIGADMRSIYYDQIRSAYVNVGLVGKLFRTGTIMIDTGMNLHRRGSRSIYARFSNIRHPYEVYRILQGKLSHRKEGLHSGRADFESNQRKYKEYVQETERYKRSA